MPHGVFESIEDRICTVSRPICPKDTKCTAMLHDAIEAKVINSRILKFLIIWYHEDTI